MQPFVQKHLHQADWPVDHVYSLSVPTNPDTQASDIKLGEQALDIYENADTCEKNGALESEWNTRVHSKLLDLIVEPYKGTVGSLNMYAFKPSSFSQLTCFQNERPDFTSVLVDPSLN